ncbi:MAG TPA: hypothetical protein VGK36_15375 [Candidatus Angelobacter sp.]|jgi:hypothetical protein
MSTATSLVMPVQLTWIKSNVKGRYELTANGPILGSLQRVGFWKSASQAEFKNQSWSFQRNGMANTLILQQPGDRPAAGFKTNWLGGGTLTFADGRQFQLTAKGFWHPVWSWMDDQGRKLLDVTPHNKSVVLVGAVDNSYLPVLIMLSWHQILQANDDATAAIAASAVAG